TPRAPLQTIPLTPHARPPAPRQLGWIALASALIVLGVGVFGVLFLRARTARRVAIAVSTAVEPATPAPTLADSEPPPGASSASSPLAASRASDPPAASSASSPPAAVAAPDDVGACLRELFPADTFQSRSPSLAFVCTETNPWKGSAQIRGEIVRA